MQNHIWLEFADGQYLAHLKNKRIDAVETATGAALGDIYARSLSGMYRDTENEWVVMPTEARWKNNELVEVVRQAFIGGGKKIVDGGEPQDVRDFQVNHLLTSYLDDRPRVELWKLAAAILHATMEGYDFTGEAEGVAPPSPKKAETEKASSDQTDSTAL